MQPWIDNALDTVARNMTAAGKQPLGYRANGRPIWPVFGAAPDDGGSSDGAAGAGGTGAGSGSGSAGSGSGSGQGSGQTGGASGSTSADGAGDLGYPANTPVAEMQQAEQVAYWRRQARLHQDRNRAYDNLTVEQLAEIRDKAGKYDQVQYDLSSTTDKLVTDAKTATRAEVIAEVTPEVISAKLDAAAARAGVSEADLAKAVEFIDAKKFLTADGKVDTDRVKAFVGSISPDRGNNGRRGPSGAGTGRQQSHTTGSAADKGRAEAQRRGFVKSDA